MKEPVKIISGRIAYRHGQRDSIQTRMSSLPDGDYTLSIEPAKGNRSLSQNARYWSILQGYSKDSGYTPDELHLALKLEILGSRKVVVFGSDRLMPNSTRKLNKKEFAEYCQRAEALLAEYFGG